MFRPLMTRWTDLDQIMVSIGLFIVMENLAQLFFGATPRMLPDPFNGATVDFGLFSTSVMRLLCISHVGGHHHPAADLPEPGPHGRGHSGHGPKPQGGPVDGHQHQP